MTDPGNEMLVLLQSKATGLFFKSPTEWVSDRLDARVFACGDEAMAARQTCGQETLVYYAFSDPEFDFSIDLADHGHLHWAA